MDFNSRFLKNGKPYTVSSAGNASVAAEKDRIGKTSVKHLRHDAIWYGIMRHGRLLGGITNPELFSLREARMWVKSEEDSKSKVVKIRVTHEVIAEVIV